MEISEKNYDKECMKLAMLNHEKTFREQVNELHRLYRVQKILMRDMKKNENFHRAKERRRVLDLERPAEEYSHEEREDGIEKESELELTLATGSRSKKTNETSLTSESTASFSSSSADSGGDNAKFHDWGSALIPGMSRNSQHPPWLYQCLSLNIA